MGILVIVVTSQDEILVLIKKVSNRGLKPSVAVVAFLFLYFN